MRLLICESPNKKKTISQFLTKNDVVEASVGHITKINDSGLYNAGIDFNTFEADFIVDPAKKDVVKHLKELADRAEEVVLITDEDREGEAIAWHLKEVLKIPAKKLKRCTFHEVTKKAVTEALNNPRKINQALVDAAISRAELDKIIGYRLSPISRRKVSARSVGRCQSVALKLIVEREEEIQKFDSKKYYELWLPFTKDKVDYKAQYKGETTSKKVIATLDDKSIAEKIVNDCKGKDYVVNSIECKDRNISPKPPFITSTYQQEVSTKLGYSVDKAMSLAQNLFEGINVGGQHVACITYIRTDDASLAPEFIDSAKSLIESNFGKDYYVGPRAIKKGKNAQEAHEAIRPVDLAMTPDKLSQYIHDSQLIKVYTLIYNRAIASLMKDAVVTDTNFNIHNGTHKFVYSEHAYKDKGFKKIYDYDDEEINQGIDIFVKEKLDAKDLELLEKETQPPRRYSEATLIKKLEDINVGRPATYASIIKTILDPGRNYAEEQGKAIAPTEKGITLSHFLDEAFPDIINYDYSAKLEEQLDEIAKGKTKKLDFMKSFYADLEKSIKNTKSIVIERPAKEYVEDHNCPKCNSKLVYRQGRFGKFIGCTNYPKCNYTEKIV